MKKIIYLVMIIQFTLFLNACDDTPLASQSPTSSFVSNQESSCMIDLRGEVMYPGIYKVDYGTLLCELIKIAGGVTKNADLTNLNLVSAITENTKITIPSKNTVSSNISNSEGKINLNTCDKEELMTIPKIGESKAEAIIKYRDEKGAFSTIDEIKNVKGIGDSLFEEIKIYITV